MKKGRELDFVLAGTVDGVEITPSTIGLARFNEFNRQVAEFIAGTDRPNLDEVMIAIEPGSYRLIATLTIALFAAIEPDLKALERQDSLTDIDPRRAAVIKNWQARSKAYPSEKFEIHTSGKRHAVVRVTSDTDFRPGPSDPWVKVEKYLFGTIVDMGGSQKANIHVRLEETDKTILVNTDQHYLKEQETNRLYHKALLRVEAQQHTRTGELRQGTIRLLSFEDYAPQYDEAALDRFAAAGRKAWADVPDPAAWVRKLRGGS